jgi:hypothetical protein
MFDFTINGNSLVVTNTEDSKILFEAPKRDFYIGNTELNQNKIQLYDTNGSNEVDARYFNCSISEATIQGAVATASNVRSFQRLNLGAESLSIIGANISESFYPESNTSFLLSGASSANIKRMITNEGYRDMYISYTDPSVAGQFVTFEPNDPPWQEKEYNGDIYGIFKYNPNGNASSETVFITTVAAFSLSILYLTLKNEAVTNVTFPAFTNLTTIEPGIYSQVGAVTPTGTITLDGDNQANPVFIFRTDGALTISANCEFILTNGATADNVYFVGDGAVTLGADSICFGNFIGLVAVTVGVDCILNGRALSLGGAVDSSGDCYVSLPPPASAYDLGYLLNFALFTSSGALSNVGASNIIVGNVGTNLGAITGFTGMNITGEVYDNTSEIEIELLNGGARVVTITA